MDYNANHKKELDFTYEGPFNMRIISTLGKYLTDFLDTSYEARMSIYRVFIEICQNVSLYSFDRVWQNKKSSVGYGKLIIKDEDDKITVYTINKILDHHADILLENCNNINNYSLDELSELKEKLRREASVEDLGAHIGLISIRLYSKNVIKFEIIDKPDEHAKYFAITATVIKTNN
jgi:hypothetical protein